MTTPNQTPAYGSPEAKARIRELKTIDRDRRAAIRGLQGEMQTIREDARGRDLTSEERDRHRELYEGERALVNELYAAKRERLDLQTRPLPVAAAELPAKLLSRDESAAAVSAPTSGDAYQPGDAVVVYSRGGWREALVVHGYPTRVEVAYTTATALREAAERGRPADPTVTRKTVPMKELYNHRPAPRATTPEEETSMSKDEQTPATRKRNGRGAAAQAARTRKAAEKATPSETPAETPEVVETPAVETPAETPVVEPETPEVVELPQRDAAPTDLATAVLDYFGETVDGHLDRVPTPTGSQERLRLNDKTIGYLTIGKRGVSVEAKTETGWARHSVKTTDDVAAAAQALVATAGRIAVPVG